jgi:hypothetical protein
MEKSSLDEHEQALKMLGFLAKGLVLFVYAVVLFVSMVIFIPFYDSQRPPPDFFYVQILEDYAGDSLPSCTVAEKLYDEWEYDGVLSATYLLDESDYQKVLAGIRSNDRTRPGSIDYYPGKGTSWYNGDYIPYKVDYKYSIARSQQLIAIAFKDPRTIFLYRIYYNK